MKEVLIKTAIAESLFKLSQSIPLKKIRVSDIVNECGISRQTFYNCFKDKEDLIAWTYVRHFDDPMETFSDYDAFCKKTIGILEANRKFYIQAYKTTGFLDWQEKWAYDNMLAYITATYGRDALTGDVQYALESFVRGSYRVFENRLNHSSKVDVSQLIENDMRNMPDILRRFFPMKK